MKSRIKMMVGGAALVCMSSLVTSTVMSNQPEGMDMDPAMMQDMMKQWMEMAQPGAEHKEMMKALGDWKMEVHQFNPMMPPAVANGKATMTSVMGGRYMVENVAYEMDVMGQKMPFEGMGIFGYDRNQDKHVMVWIDNMGTGILHGVGEANDAGDEVTYKMQMAGPAGSMMDVRMVSRAVSDEHHQVEMYATMPDGSEFKTMQIESTR